MKESLVITSCRVTLNRIDNERLKGFATIVFNHVFAVCDLKIIKGNNGLFVAMPSRRRRDGTFHDVAHPIVPTMREYIEDVVLDEYYYEVASDQGDQNEAIPAREHRNGGNSARLFKNGFVDYR